MKMLVKRLLSAVNSNKLPNSKLILHHQPDHAQRRSAQRIGILAPRRLLVDRPETNQRVELVRQRDRDAHRIGRHAVVRSLRLVMLLDRRAHAGMLALQLRVAPAHQALNFREFADHLRHQVGLRQRRGARRKIGVGADDRRQLARQRPDARDAFSLSPKLFVKDDIEMRELGHALVERLLKIEREAFRRVGVILHIRQRAAIRLPEIQRVRQARADDAAVAGDDGLAAVACGHVRCEQEFVGELSIAVAQNEAFLVGADRRADHLRRRVEKALVEIAHQHDRPFNQAGHFFKQALILDQFEILRMGEIARVGRDDVLAPVGVEHDERLFELGDIILEALHPEFRRREEAVAARPVARFKAVDLEMNHIGVFGLRPEGAEDGLQRPHPAQRFRAFRIRRRIRRADRRRRRAPAHGFRPREIADDSGDDLRDRVGRRLPLLLDYGDVEFALLRVLLDLGLRDVAEPRALEKSLHGRVRRADARALALLARVASLHRQPDDGEREPPRRRERFRALIDEPAIDQRVGDERFQVLGRAPLHARRDFFGEEFEQEVRHQAASTSIPLPPLAMGRDDGRGDAHQRVAMKIRVGQRGVDGIGRGVDIAENLVVPEAQHAIAVSVESGRPFDVSRRIFGKGMMLAVDFDDELCIMTDKISKIGSDRRLSSKMRLRQWNVFQARP